MNYIDILYIIFILFILWVIYLSLLTYYDRTDEDRIDAIVRNIQNPLKTNERLISLKTEIDTDLELIVNERITDPVLHEIISKSLKGGKRLRPIIAYSIVTKINPDIDRKKLLTLDSIEILHTASLMVDDLMDGDDVRRGEIAPHVIYGRDLTLMAASQMAVLALTMVAELDLDNILQTLKIRDIRDIQDRKMKKYKLLIKNILEKNARLIDGQSVDLRNSTDRIYKNGEIDILKEKEIVLDVLSKKTSSIFQMIFAMSWLLGGGDQDRCEDVDKLADDFGVMFQIYDDFTDIVSDKRKNFNLNYVLRFGTIDAYDEFVLRRDRFIAKARELNIMTYELHIIIIYLTDVVVSVKKADDKNLI